jgi:hypothetical protein
VKWVANGAVCGLAMKQPRRTVRRRFSLVLLARILLLALLGGATAVTVACDDPISHIYTARAFDRVRGCLGPNLSIDVLVGADPGSGCQPICVVGRSSVVIGAPEVVYVTTMCAPHPPSFDITGKRSECTSALAAIRRSDSCARDGGGVNTDASATESIDAAETVPGTMPDAGAANDANDANNAEAASDQ